MAFIGPGGPEFLMVMLVLLLLFGAKDAPRILRKLYEVVGQIRNTAEGFRREVMYSDLINDPPPHASPEYEDDDAENDDDNVDPEEPDDYDDMPCATDEPQENVADENDEADGEGNDRKD
jgi:Sec-independent protein translocase protein TatA